ncbi:AAA family ATPase [Sphingomonas sp. A2-49]|uniref:AAA family ATPase n=1 Tax=Sphingomonas sp. A2-49 TaxID=1391375 RepID=UPI0021CFF7BF|nr:AAA family ATPase [Sphingomonas sp. A2-49]MCU6453930.1 AAA family ATPase [Sphingomonas sp. A2-49]
MIQVDTIANDKRSAAHLTVTKRVDVEAQTQAVQFWEEFGFVAGAGKGGSCVPKGVVALETRDAAVHEALWRVLQQAAVQSRLTVVAGDSVFQFFTADASSLSALRAAVPEGVIVHGEGSAIALPADGDYQPDEHQARSLTDLTILELERPQSEVSSESPQALVTGNPLEQYSLHGHLAELEASALQTSPLLGGVVLAGQATIVFAQPGSGKTLLTIWLLIEAITAGRILGGNVYYMNGDDSSSGVADKMRLLEEVGAHMLVPGLQGFSAGKLVALMRQMVVTDTCRGVVIVVDTLKKVVDTMDKKDSTAFGQVVRECVAKGATFIGLGHTRKNPSAKGKLVHAGTTDLLEDADAACILTPLDARPGSGEKVVQFQFIKRRGGNVDEAFAYADGNTASYDELVASVRRVDPENVERLVGEADERTDEPIIDAIVASIADGAVQKMQLAQAAAKRARVSARAAIKVIERYQGDDPERHRWSYSVRDRGAKVYRLLTT